MILWLEDEEPEQLVSVLNEHIANQRMLERFEALTTRREIVSLVQGRMPHYLADQPIVEGALEGQHQ
jgi:hypothetical protein